MTQFQTWLTRTKGALTRTRTKYEFFRLLTPSSANMGAKIYVFCKVGRPCPRWDFPMTQLALFPFSQVLPMKLKREWAAAISKPIGKGFVGNGAQRSSKYYTHNCSFLGELIVTSIHVNPAQNFEAKKMQHCRPAGNYCSHWNFKYKDEHCII